MDPKFEQAGVNLLNKAKEDRISRKRSSDSELQSVCLDASKWAWAKPVSIHLSGLTNYRKKRKKTKCFICRTTGGVFYIEDGKAYCREDKHAMHMSKEDLTDYLINRRKGISCLLISLKKLLRKSKAKIKLFTMGMSPLNIIRSLSRLSQGKA